MLSIIKKFFNTKNNQWDSYPTDPAYYKKQGNDFLALGNIKEAENCYRQHINAQSEDVDGYLNLGFVLVELGQYDEAESFLLKSIVLDNSREDNHYLLGLIYQKKGLIEKSIEYYQSALNINPLMEVVFHHLYQIYSSYSDLLGAKQLLLDKAKSGLESSTLHYYAGCIYLADNNLDEADNFFQKALSFDPDNEQIYLQLGSVYRKQKKHDLAADLFQKVIKINKNNFMAHNNLGCIFQEQGNIEEAISCFQLAIAINPNNAEVHNNLGLMFYKNRELEAALSEYKKAISINPGLIDTYINMARTYYELHHYDEAMECYEKVLKLGKGNAAIIHDIGEVLRRQGNLQKAIDQYRHAISISEVGDEIFNRAYRNLLYLLSYYKNCSPEQYLQEANIFGKTLLAKATPYRDWLIDKNQHRPLRIGLVSGDFMQHPVGFFIAGFLSEVDPDRLQIFAYMTLDRRDDMTQRIQSHVTAWRDIAYLEDRLAAEQIREDCIDILIDLSGYTGGGRVSLFAWKPAPIQASWLGYWASTGVPGIDYLLTDLVSVPVESQKNFSETIWYLPHTRLCFTPPSPDECAAVAESPVIVQKHITFGSFQSVNKMNSDVFALWGAVLKALPSATLRLQAAELVDAGMRAYIMKQLEAAGIEPNRVILKGAQTRKDYFSSYGEVDIVLETFPFPGATTTCEALWMGVPTVTLPRNTMLSRVTASLLTCAGLGDWVAQTEEEYIAIAIKKAGDINALARLRANLREQVKASPLFDARLFARHFEKAMFDMWEEKMSVRVEHKTT